MKIQNQKGVYKMRINFKTETLDALSENNKTENDVIGVYENELDQWLEWEEFKRRADFYYDNGYGGEEINMDLKIIGKDWWLERRSYDGAEWWEFQQMPPWDKRKPAITTLAYMPEYIKDDPVFWAEEYHTFIK